MTTRLEKLKACNSKPDFARLLGIDPVFMTRVIYIRNTENLYSQFAIKKKNGSDRVISAPDSELKEIQSKLSDLLQDCLNNLRENLKKIIISLMDLNATAALLQMQKSISQRSGFLI